MVSKKTNAAKQTASLKKAEDTALAEPKKKTSTVKSKAAAPKKSTEKEVKKQAVPETHNVDVVGDVLNIKSQNEAKKAGKSSRSTSAKVKEESVVEAAAPESKNASHSNKHAAVKENAKIAEAKKFAEMKGILAEIDTESDAENSAACGGAWCAWLNAYKNIFNFKGRSSRFEFWSFMLINMFILLAFCLGIEFMGDSLLTMTLSAVVYIAQIIVYLAMFVRRLHDAGYSSWKGFFKPLLISWILTAATSVYLVTFTPVDPLAIQIALVVAVLLLLTYGYYAIKTFVAAGFFEEERNANVYGAASFIDDAHKMRSLKYASIYLLIIILGYLISLSSIFYGVLASIYAY